MFPQCVQNIHHNLAGNSLQLSSHGMSLLLMSSTEKERVKPSGEDERDESKDKGQLKGEERDTADSGRVIFTERSDSLEGPGCICTCECLCMNAETIPSCMEKHT